MARKDNFSDTDLWEELFRIRDQQRERANKGISVVKGRDIPWQNSRQGKLKWYLHPALQDPSLNSYLVYAQEIPPGSRTGRIKTQGNEVLIMLKGEGYTEFDGVRHPWKAGDTLGLPLRQGGFVIQHFNLSATEPARFLSVRPNLLDALTVDAGGEFEQLEAAPEWRPASRK